MTKLFKFFFLLVFSIMTLVLFIEGTRVIITAFF